MPRSRAFTHGVIFGFSGQALAMLSGLWLSPFLLHRLGTAGYGFWILGQQALVYISLLDLGIVARLPRETAALAGRDAECPGVPSDLSDLVARTAQTVLLQTLLLAAIGFALWAFFPAARVDLRRPVGFACLAIVVFFPFRIFRAVLEGLQDLAFIGRVSLLSWLAGLLLSAALVAQGFGLNALPAGWALTQALDAGLCVARVRRRFPSVLPRHWLPRARPTRPPLVVHAVARRLSAGGWVCAGQIAQVLTCATDSAVVGNLFGAAAVVPYACTGKLVAILTNPPQLIMRAAEPALSAMRFSERRERLASVTGTLTLAMLLVSGLAAALTLAVNPAFVPLWMGSRVYAGAPLTVLFALSMLLRHLNVTAIYALFFFGRERFLAVTALADGVLSTALSIVFAWRFRSPSGVVCGSIVSTLCILLLCNGPALARELNASLARLARPLAGWAWRMFAVAWAASCAGAAERHAGPLALAGLALTVVAAYVALMLPFVMRSSLRPYLDPYLDSLRSFARFPATAEER